MKPIDPEHSKKKHIIRTIGIVLLVIGGILILIGLGANLAHPEHGAPRATCEAALDALKQAGLVVVKKSSWYKSAPVPASSQPWFINGVIAVETSQKAMDLLSLLLAVEDSFGRARGKKNAARTLDLDLIAYGDTVIGWDDSGQNRLSIPHRRLNERGFVLLPLAEIAPHWRHPVLHLSLRQMIATLDPNQQTLRDEESLKSRETG